MQSIQRLKKLKRNLSIWSILMLIVAGIDISMGAYLIGFICLGVSLLDLYMVKRTDNQMKNLEKLALIKIPMRQKEHIPDHEWLKNLKVGDTVIRWLAAVVPMEMRVTKIEDEIIYISPCMSLEEFVREAEIGKKEMEDMMGTELPPINSSEMPTWEFDQKTGFEVDKSLGWDGQTRSGSFIAPKSSV